MPPSSRVQTNIGDQPQKFCGQRGLRKPINMHSAQRREENSSFSPVSLSDVCLFDQQGQQGQQGRKPDEQIAPFQNRIHCITWP